METERKGLPKEVTESAWFKNLPVMDWKGMLKPHRKKLAEIGVNPDSLDEKYLSFVATLMNGWVPFEKILSLERVFEHLDEAWQRYEDCFDMGFCDMTRNVESVLKELKEAYYSD